MSITFTLIPYENFPLMFITFPIYTIGFIYGLIITTRYREINKSGNGAAHLQRK
jgi:hypothetical protein